MRKEITTPSSDIADQRRRRKPLKDQPAEELPQRFQTSQSASESIDQELVDKTKQQIQSLVGEITALAKSESKLPDFIQGFLIRTTSALASEGGAVWLDVNGTGALELQYHINLDQLPLAKDPVAQARHSALLTQLRSAGEAALIPPNSGFADNEDAGNPPTNCWLSDRLP